MNEQSSKETNIDFEALLSRSPQTEKTPWRRLRKDVSRIILYILIALFLLVTLCYALLLSVFKIPFKKLALSYAIIVTILLIIFFIRRDLREGSIMSYIIRKNE